MSFARNFAAGQQIAQNAMDTFRDARQRRDLGRIADARPEEFDGFTQADGDQLRAMSQAINPETGQPYYDVQDNGRGGLQVRNNFSFAGQDGQMVDPGSITGLQPRRVTEFLGQRREGSFTPEQMEALRSRAMADVVSRGDPIAGLRMRREIGQEEREAERFGWDRQQQPLRQRAAELQVAGAERGERGGVRADTVQSIVDQALNIPQEQIGPQLMQYLNTNQSDLPLIVLSTGKDGLQVAERNPVTGEIMPPFNLPYSVGQKLVAGMALQQAGKGAEAIQLLSNVDDRITDLITRYNNQAMDVARFNNDVGQARFGREMDEARLGIERDRLGLQRRAASAADRPNFQLVGTDERGEPVWVDMNRLGSGEDGRMQLPAGVAPMRLPQSLSDAEKIAYERAIEQVAMLPPDAPPGAAADVFRRFGLDPQRFTGNAGLPTSSRFGGSGDIAPAGRLTPIPPLNVTRPNREPAFGNPANFERRSERGLFGGVNYYYFDPATGRKLTTEQYNRLTAR